MKKIFFLSALLCASMMSWATTDWTGSVSGVANNVWTAGEDHGAVNYTINYLAVYSSASEQLTVTFELAGDILSTKAYTQGTLSSPNMYIRSTNTFYNVTNNTCVIAGAREIGEVVTAEFHIVYNAGEFYKEFSYTIPDDGSGSLPSSDLSLNATETTLNADESQTFQINPTTAVGYDGTVTYASSNDNIATVTSSGLVTAVGKGVATITVTAPATASFQKSTQTLTVTVNSSQVNWATIDWLGDGAGGGLYSNKYKLAAADGQGVVNIQNREIESVNHPGIYTTFSGDITYCSLGEGNYSVQGAGMWLFLSAFTAQYTNVTVKTNAAGETTYNFIVYYVGGATAIDNLEAGEKAIKVIENGQLIIIKNGVRYNALGAQL